MKVCIIKPLTSQETTAAIMQDIAILTGGKVRVHSVIQQRNQFVSDFSF